MTQPAPIPPDTPLPADSPSGSRWAKAHHVLLIFLALAIVIWVLTGIYTVPSGHVALVERMGQLLTTPAGEPLLIGPGQQFGCPWGIDTHHIIPFDQQQTLIVSDFFEPRKEYEELKREFGANGVPREVLDAALDPYLLTGDKNILKARATVIYTIPNPALYFMSISHAGSAKAQQDALTQVIEHAMIRAMSHAGVDYALGTGKTALANAVQQIAQPEIDRLSLGLRLSTVTLDITWPANVDAEFTAVGQARQNMDTLKNNAEAQKQGLITNAQNGEAKRIILEAEAYKARMIADAEGERSRFDQVFKRYRAAPQLTIASLYADAVSDILTNVTRKLSVERDQRANVVIDLPEEPPGPPRPAPPR